MIRSGIRCWWPGNPATAARWRLPAIRRGAGRWSGSAMRIVASGGSACCGWRRKTNTRKGACGFAWPAGGRCAARAWILRWGRKTRRASRSIRHSFEVAVRTPEGRAVDVRPAKSGDGLTAMFRETNKPGDYKITVTAKNGDRNVGHCRGADSWCPIKIWSSTARGRAELMAQLAEMTKPAGGAALAAEELPDLLKRLADKPPELKEEVVAKVTYWDTWPFFLLFVGPVGRGVVFAEAVGIGVN